MPYIPITVFPNVKLVFGSNVLKFRISDTTMSITIYGNNQVQIFGQMVEKVTQIILKREFHNNLRIRELYPALS